MYPPNAVVFDGNGFLINRRRFLLAQDIARKHGYVGDYVARLCREGKVPAHRIGKLWYADVNSFAAFIASVNRRKTDPSQSTV